MSEKHGRIAYFDNVKGILIALVVLGHVISPVIATNPYANLLHHTIYLFHMPLFVFTTGLFSASVFSSGALKVERILSYTLENRYQAAELNMNRLPNSSSRE